MAFGIDDAIGAGLTLINKFIADPMEKIKAENSLRKDLLAADTAQMRVNAKEATHRSVFVAGWRPMIGWTCAFAFGMHFIIIPLMTIVAIYIDFTPPLVAFDMDSLMSIMLGMLGIGGLRTYEKTKGITK